jgi:hypothetical protein
MKPSPFSKGAATNYSLSLFKGAATNYSLSLFKGEGRGEGFEKTLALMRSFNI